MQCNVQEAFSTHTDAHLKKPVQYTYDCKEAIEGKCKTANQKGSFEQFQLPFR